MEAAMSRWAAGAAIAIALFLAAAPAAPAAVTGTVGGVAEPASGVLRLTVLASEDSTVGLRRASVKLAGRFVDAGTFGDPGCDGSSPDPALACPGTGSVTLEVPTTAVPDGSHRLEVLVEDGAARVFSLFDREIVVDNSPVLRETSVTLVLGSSGLQSGPGSPGNGGGPRGGRGNDCRSPRLTMSLDQPPLAFRGPVPVLRAGRYHRFRGRLTCVVGGRRRSAPRGTLVGVRNVSGGRTVVKPPLRVGAEGRIVARLRYWNSRVIVFEARSARGGIVRVRIPVRIALAGRSGG